MAQTKEQQNAYDILIPVAIKRIRNITDFEEAGQFLNSLVYDCCICPCNGECCKDVSMNCRENLKSWLRLNLVEKETRNE